MMRLRNPVASLRSFIDRIRRMDETIHRLQSTHAALTAHVQSLHEEVDAILPVVRETREISMVSARRLTLRRKPARVVFLVHNPAAWGSISEVVRIMIDDPDFDPVVISIPHHYSGVGPSKGENDVHAMLEAEQVPHLRLPSRMLSSGAALLRTLEPDLVFRQSQWDADIDPLFAVEQLRWVRSVLIPYETMNIVENRDTDDTGTNSALDSPLHREAWLVFVANESVAEMARASSGLNGRQFRVVGHPKFDRLRQTAPSWPLRPRNADGARRRIVWSAHHSILRGWNDFGLFPRIRQEMVDWATTTASTDFVFMHHPMLPDTICRPGGPLSLTDYENWLEEWCRLPNAAYWQGDYAQALRATDFLITDSPSMMIEAQVMDKSIIFLERDGHVPFNAIGNEMAQGVHLVTGIDQARETIAGIEACHQDPLAEARASNIRRFFAEPGAARRIVETIRSELAVELS